MRIECICGVDYYNLEDHPESACPVVIVKKADLASLKESLAKAEGERDAAGEALLTASRLALAAEARASAGEALLRAQTGLLMIVADALGAVPLTESVDKQIARIDAHLSPRSGEGFEEWHARECPFVKVERSAVRPPPCGAEYVWRGGGLGAISLLPLAAQERFRNRTCREVFDAEQGKEGAK